MQSSPSTGYTREFKDFRHYTRDDDYRAIDWRLYARLDKLFIRLYEEIQEYHIHVMIDTSASMNQPFKEKQTAALNSALLKVDKPPLRCRVSGSFGHVQPGKVHKIVSQFQDLLFFGAFLGLALKERQS